LELTQSGRRSAAYLILPFILPKWQEAAMKNDLAANSLQLPKTVGWDEGD
jgi:hypothetical protein